MPRSAINEIAAEGAGFAGFAAHLDMIPADPDMLAMPDLTRMAQLPWKPEAAWVPCDLHMDGSIVDQAPRATLQRIISAASEAGYSFMTGVWSRSFSC